MKTTECSTHAFLSNYQEACRYLESFINYEQRRDFQYNPRTFNLVRMEQLLSSLGNPHHQLRTIHVAGSKGKGSTAAIIASILSTAGYGTGLYTSPHLVSSRERFRIDNQLITEDEFLNSVRRLSGQLDAMRESGNPPTFFEIYTAIGFLYFSEAKVDWTVLEVGLGGRLDATNVITHPGVSVITPISLEHTSILGNSLAEIAFEKGGIIKEGCPVVLAPQPREAREVLLDICKARHATCVEVATAVSIGMAAEPSDGQRFDLKTRLRAYSGLTLPLLGNHQRINAATAITAVELLNDPAISDHAIHAGLSRVCWPGRMQVISESPRIILDGAHSPASMQALKFALAETFSFGRLILVIGLSQDKDILSIGQEICPVADSIILTKASDMPRAMEPSRIQELWTPLALPTKIIPRPKDALEEASQQAGQQDLICVTGSLYLVGEVLRQFGYEPDRLCSDAQKSPTRSGFIHHKAGEEKR